MWWTPEPACIWSAGKTFNSAEKETVRISKSPTTVVTANGEVLTNEEATVFVREFGFNRDCPASQRYTGVSLTRKTLPVTRETLRRSRILLRVDRWSDTTYHQQWERRSIASRRTSYRSLSLVYRQALQAQLHLRLQHQ